MLAFIEARYDHALDEVHRRFLADFRVLPEAARCLYVRFANRRGRAFLRDYLRYPEIESIDEALAALAASDFARPPRPDDFHDLLVLQGRGALVALVKAHAPPAPEERPRPSSAKKAELVRHLASRASFETCFPVDEQDRYLVQRRTDELEFLLFLYFGRLERSLTTFALRDLGIVRTPEFRKEFEARFANGAEARASFHYARVLERLESGGENVSASLLEEIETWTSSEDLGVETMRHRAIHRLGRLLEREARADLALSVYERSGQFPSTERVVRLLVQENRRAEAEAMLLRLVDDPSCDEELLFAEDFLERKFQRRKTGRLTAMLRSASVLRLDEAWRGRAEEGAAAHYRRRGEAAHHVENAPWLQLFGLLFWDLLFESENSSLHNPFELRPGELASGAFFQRNPDAIAARLRTLDDPDSAVALLEAVWKRAEGKPNALFPWDAPLFTLVKQLVLASPPGALATLLEALARDHRAHRCGFPDLLVFTETGVRFVEIKAEGDQIRRHQLVQIERLRRAGFPIEVVKVEWSVDPEQDYVVVDLETTGGDAARNRITEIGAVRVRRGKIVAEWSTLVNPGRRIPSYIVGLTGITDAMVETAPPFEEVAAPLREFLADAVFVAHRAKFDHGFLKAEYERLGESLSCPSLCTVVESRRHFPGLTSYGLAALSAHFDIPLESHHRALCDARATAEILLRIQGKRLASEGPEKKNSFGESHESKEGLNEIEFSVSSSA